MANLLLLLSTVTLFMSMNNASTPTLCLCEFPGKIAHGTAIDGTIYNTIPFTTPP